MENETPHFKIYTHLTQFYSPTWAKKLIRWVYTPLSCFSKNSISGAYLSFFVLIAALGVFLVLILAKNQMKLATSVSHLSGRKNLALSPTPIPFNRNYTTLAFNPSSSRLKVGQTENLNLIIQTGANLVAGVEFTLKFDPSKLEILSVAPAGFLEKPNILANKLDNKNGSLYYAIGTFTPKSGSGNLITLLIKAKKTNQASLTFTSDTKVAAKGEGSENVLRSAQEAQVIISL